MEDHLSGLKLSEALPAFAAELERLLRSQGYDHLASQVESLPLVDRCRCGDEFCATFYTAPRPTGAYGPGHSNLEVPATEGMIILDLADEGIECVEVLYRPDVQRALHAALP